MQKQLIGALIGGLILFIWQFISFGPGNLHSSQMQHLPQQDAILKALVDNNVPEGEYFLPRLPLDAGGDAQEQMAKDTKGKPWAQLNYHHAYELTFGPNLARGFLVDFLSVFLLSWLLLRMKDLDMKTAIIASLIVGAIGYMTIRLVRRHLDGRYGQNLILYCVKIFSNNYGYSEKFCLVQN